MTRALHSQFCDDIRQEVGNKLSLMGIYNGLMVVPSFPYELPRLFVCMRATASAGEEFKSLTFVVMVNDESIAEISIPNDQVNTPAPEIPEFPNASDLQRQQSFQTFFGLPPMRFEHPTVIRTRLVTETEIIRGDSVMIVAAQQAQQQSPTA